MSEKKLPNQVYRLRQGDFAAIPGNPWVYWVSKNVQQIFSHSQSLSEIAEPKQGLATADNMRFLRFWWEIPIQSIDFSCRKHESSHLSHKKWFPCMKGGSFSKWIGNQEYIVNWFENGKEIQNFFGPSGKLASRPQNTEYYFREGITWSLISSKGPGFRIIPPGWIITHKGPGIYFPTTTSINQALAILNSVAISGLLSLISPTMGFEIGQLSLLPWPNLEGSSVDFLSKLSNSSIWLSRWFETKNDASIDFVIPLAWNDGSNEVNIIQQRLIDLEKQINREVYQLFEIDQEDQAFIEADLAGGELVTAIENDGLMGANEEETAQPNIINQDYIASNWLSYAIGIILGRFQPGTPGALGSAINRCTDFAIGSLPEPSEEEFNELVGDPSQFAYVDELGGRHVFSRQVEVALQKLALPDGIAVFDPNHPRDLPTLVSKALELMLGQAQAQEVIQQAANGDLRKYLEKDFFTQHHIKQYRKRPVYWPIQSSKRSYGFVLFHEKIDRNTFYALQQEPYLPTKRRAVQLRLEELSKKVLTAQGAARKPIEKEMDELRQLAEELAQFAKDLDAITRGGYEPEADWIDDGVILRMAPLWSVIPLWKSEPKKYWEELAAGKYDWSRIALKYWPERVKQACKKNKSYAIAHGHEEWFIGN